MLYREPVLVYKGDESLWRAWCDWMWDREAEYKYSITPLAIFTQIEWVEYNGFAAGDVI